MIVSLALAGAMGCASEPQLSITSPTDAKSAVLILRDSSAELQIEAQTVPFGFQIPPEFSVSEGVALFFDVSLGALRLGAGPLELDLEGILVEELGSEVDSTPLVRAFSLRDGEYQVEEGLPTWAAQISLLAKDLTSVCPSVTLGPALDVPEGRYQARAVLPDGSLLVVGTQTDVRGAMLYRIEDDGGGFPSPKPLHSIGVNPKHIEVLEDEIAFAGRVLTGTTSVPGIVFAARNPLIADEEVVVTTTVTFPQQTARLDTVEALLTGSTGRDGLKAVLRNGEIFEWNELGSWQTIATSTPTEAPCEQDIGWGRLRYAAFTQTEAGTFIGYNLGSSTFSRLMIRGLREGDPPQPECLDQALLGGEQLDASHKIIGAIDTGFLGKLTLEFGRFEFEDELNQWELTGRHYSETDAPQTTDLIDLGPDAPPAFLYGSETGAIGALFVNGAVCSSIGISTNSIRWIWKLDNERYLAAPQVGIPRWVEVRP